MSSHWMLDGASVRLQQRKLLSISLILELSRSSLIGDMTVSLFVCDIELDSVVSFHVQQGNCGR